MIKKSIFSVIFLFLFGACLLAEEYKVLFLGNSYTYVNNLPQLIASIATSGGDTLIFSQNLPGGSTFSNHVSNATSVAFIQQGGWDYVVLQGQSQEPSFPDEQFYAETYPYAQQLCGMIQQYNPCTKVVFYMTWGRKYGDQTNCPYFLPLCTYEGMDSLLYLRYMTMASNFNAEVSPVGALWHYLHDHHPEIELYASDGSHPSLAGSYAAACAFYSVIFKKNPINVSYNPGIAEDEAESIRMASSNIVYDSLAKWFVDMPSSIRNTYGDDIRVFPIPATEYVDIQSGKDIVEIRIFAEDGSLIWSKTAVSARAERIPVSAFNTGLYFIQIVDREGNVVRKKIIKK